MNGDMTGRDPLGPDGWEGERFTPPADQVNWEPPLDLLPAVEERPAFTDRLQIPRGSLPESLMIGAGCGG